MPRGVSYNAYLADATKRPVLFDTVDSAVGDLFFENLAHALDGRALDYVVIQHMEPDHSATLGRLLEKFPAATVVCNQENGRDDPPVLRRGRSRRARFIVKEGDTLSTGRHAFSFVMAPMVHWPEVMVTYDAADKILFSADAFGTFGALNGALFADEVDFFRDYLDEARRYYCNIVGKYGMQVQAVLKKAAALEIALCLPAARLRVA